MNEFHCFRTIQYDSREASRLGRSWTCETFRAAPRVARRKSLAGALCRILLPLTAALAIAIYSSPGYAAELEGPLMPSKTVMGMAMETLRIELNALAAQTRNIENMSNSGERRELVRAHVARLRPAIASTRAMENRMHDALARGQISVDYGARARHVFMLDQFASMMALVEQSLGEMQAPGDPGDCPGSSPGRSGG